MYISIGELRSLIRECVLEEDSSSVARQFDVQRSRSIGEENADVPGSFSGSQMVDGSGNPLVFYHGTRKEFSKFSKEFLDSSGTAISTNYLGFYFTTSPDVAKVYISKKFDPKKGQYPSGKIIRFFLDVKKPYHISEKTYWKWGHGSSKEMEDLVQHLKTKGYDGIVMPSVWRGRGKGAYDVVVFDSNQIIKAD